MAACPFLTGMWTFRCMARANFVIPSITEETRYCLGKHPDRCPHYPEVRPEKGREQIPLRSPRNAKAY